MRRLTILLGILGAVAACTGDDEAIVDGAPLPIDACAMCPTPDARIDGGGVFDDAGPPDSGMPDTGPAFDDAGPPDAGP